MQFSDCTRVESGRDLTGSLQFRRIWPLFPQLKQVGPVGDSDSELVGVSTRSNSESSVDLLDLSLDLSYDFMIDLSANVDLSEFLLNLEFSDYLQIQSC